MWYSICNSQHIMKESLLFRCQYSQNAKVNGSHFHYLENGLLQPQFFPLFCRWQCVLRRFSPVIQWWCHVTFCFHPWKACHKTCQQRIKALHLPEFFGSSLVSPCWKKKSLKVEYASSLARKIAKTFIHICKIHESKIFLQTKQWLVLVLL